MYNTQPTPQVSISLVQVFMTIVIVAVAFALPVYLISEYRTQEHTTDAYTVSSTREREQQELARGASGRVAGANTGGNVLGSIINEQLATVSEAQLLTVGGGTMLALAALLLLYLVFTQGGKKQELEFEESTVESF